MSQTVIKNRLKSLEDLELVSVEVSSDNCNIDITHSRHHGMDFSFRWVNDDHFLGYFIDADGNKSQAVISLYTGLDAIKFSTAYALLDELRANQRG